MKKISRRFIPPSTPATVRSISPPQEYEEVSEDEEEYEDDGDDAAAPVVTPAAAAAAAAAAGGPAAAGATPAMGPKEWVGLASLPTATQKSLVDLLSKLRTKVSEARGRESVVCVCVYMGEGSVGDTHAHVATVS